MVEAVWKSKPQLEKLLFINNKTGDLQLKALKEKYQMRRFSNQN